MKREKHYMEKTIEELFGCYEHENGRINKDDAIKTKNAIKNELHKRVDAVNYARNHRGHKESRIVHYGVIINYEMTV